MKKMMRAISYLLVAVMTASMMSMTAYADDVVSNDTYEATNSYVLNFWGKYNAPLYEHVGPFRPQVTYAHADETEVWRISIMSLYNINNLEEHIGAYCADNWTSLQQDTFYRRVNLEDSSFYSDAEAGLLRSVVLNGFPHTTVEKLAEAAGVEGLTQGEAITATQLAIWKAAYGDYYIVNDYFYDIFTPWTAGNCWNFDSYYEEVKNGYVSKANEAVIEDHIETVYEYLVHLKPTAPMEVAVSNASFVDWSDCSVLTDNGDGTYDVAVAATVDVVENEGDSLTLNAVLGDYFTTVELDDGEQTVNLTIRDVPAALADNAVAIAIDGVQTVSDVFLFTVDGERETAQALTAYCDLQLPVHAEVVAEPERVINFYKTTKINIGEDGNGGINYTRIPLSGITFDLYLVAELDDYVSGAVTLPEEIDLSTLGDPENHYPDYTVTTNEFGKASVSLTKNNLPDGVYVIAERDNAAIIEPIAPFYIMMPNTNADSNGWDYQVTIEPKNAVIDGPEVNKDVITIDQKKASVDAGEEFTWIIRGELPVDLADAKEYVITDELDYRLSYADDLKVKVEEITAEANSVSDGDALVKDVDYTLSVTKEETTISGEVKTVDKLEVKLTAAGMDKVAKIAKLAELAEKESPNYEIRVYFNSIIDGDAAVGEEIPNDAELVYISSVGFRYEDESDDPRVYTCGIDIYKYDVKNEAKALEGAKFMLARVAAADEVAAGKSCSLVTENGVVNVVYEKFYNTAKMTGDKVEVAVTGTDGKAAVYGLESGEYYLVEVQAPKGYNLLSYPVPVVLSEEQSLVSEKVANSNAFVLPETGGIGRTIFTVCGIALIGVAVVILIVKKKKDNEDEEE